MGSSRIGEIEAMQLKQLDYVQALPRDGRIVYLLPYLKDDGSFRLPHPISGQIEELFAEPAESAYIAPRNMDADRDVEARLLTTIIRHLSFPSLVEPYQKVESDLVNLAAVIDKYFILLHHANTVDKHSYRAHLTTEYEYLLVNLRAFYDQLQFLFREFWQLILQEGKRELPRGFNDLAKCAKRELIVKYNLPDAFAEFVTRAAPVFEQVRTLRVGIEHHGHTERSFFHFDDGFAVSVARGPWSAFPIWDTPLVRTNGLGPYLRVLAWLVREALIVTELFDAAIKATVPLPRPPVTNWNVYLRSSCLRHFVHLSLYFDEPWRIEPGYRVADGARET